MTSDPFAAYRDAEERVYNLEKLEDKIFLQGFGAPLSTERALRASPAFIELKEEVHAANDVLSNALKGTRKLVEFTPSLSHQWLKQGQLYARKMLSDIHGDFLKAGCNKEQALLILTGAFGNSEVNRQSATFSIHFNGPEAEVSYKGIKLPLRTGSGGLSGHMAEQLETAVKNIFTQMRDLCAEPQAERLFEKAMQAGRAFHR